MVRVTLLLPKTIKLFMLKPLGYLISLASLNVPQPHVRSSEHSLTISLHACFQHCQIVSVVETIILSLAGFDFLFAIRFSLPEGLAN
jgi:hypothetical protein